MSGLPSGKPIEWLHGMSSPVALLSPPTLPQKYPIYTMNYPDYLTMSAKNLQDLFRRYPAIVVNGRPTRLKCNLESLAEWGEVDDLKVMHGKFLLKNQCSMINLLLAPQTTQDLTLTTVMLFLCVHLTESSSKHQRMSTVLTIL